jgi:succinate dehydrogenase/fumarate reductase flavoprotein subunit
MFDPVVANKFTASPWYISTAPGLAYAYLADYKRNRRDIYHQAGTIRGLAQAVGISVEALERTIGEYNTSRPTELPALVSPPFYALGPAKNCIPITDGGLRVSNQLEVLNHDGTAIKGLFAAGSTGQGGLLLAAPGIHLSWAFTSGRIAGRNASRG